MIRRSPRAPGARTLTLLAALACAGPAIAQHGGHQQGGQQAAGQAAASPYAGQQAREIKSLSEDDIAELRRGGGWGLAKAAELNGIPGPAHLLELANRIDLTPQQVATIRTAFERMRADAIREGETLISLEADLGKRFRDRAITTDELRAALRRIEGSRAELRLIHLRAHLDMQDVVTKDQQRRYTELRGYAADPCASVPPGHDPALWRRHNGCAAN